MTAYGFLIKQIEHDAWQLRALNGDAHHSVDLARAFIRQQRTATAQLNLATLVAQLSRQLLRAERRAAKIT